ncbi:MAG: hypothetical protein ABSD03_06980 [Vulcanimicrobiaceae bacterium]
MPLGIPYVALALALLAPAPATADAPAVSSSASAPVFVQLCRTSTQVSLLGKVTVGLDITFNVRDTRTADVVEFYLERDMGPAQDIAWHDVGTFAPDVTVHQTFYQSVPWGNTYGSAACFVTAVHFTDGTEWRRGGTFLTAERPTLAGDFGLPAQLNPTGIALTSDGSPWITETDRNRLARLDPQRGSVVSEVPIPTPNAGARFVAAGAGGTIWFTETAVAKIGMIDAGGAVHEYALPCNGCHPTAIAAAPDGRLWFAETSDGPATIGVIAPDGTITQIPLAAAVGFAAWVAPAKDGTVWVAESGGKIVQLAADGTQLFQMVFPSIFPTVGPEPLTLDWIGQNASGAIWYAGRRGERAVLAGTILVGADGKRSATDNGWSHRTSSPVDAAFDGTGKLWLADTSGRMLLRVDGTRLEVYNLGLTAKGFPATPASLAVAADGSLWCAETLTDKVLHLVPH